MMRRKILPQRLLLWPAHMSMFIIIIIIIINIKRRRNNDKKYMINKDISSTYDLIMFGLRLWCTWNVDSAVHQWLVP